VDVTTGGPGQRLRAAVIGTGFVGPFHVDAIRRTGLGEVVAIAASDAGRTAAKAAALGVERWTADAAELIADPSIHVIVVRDGGEAGPGVPSLPAGHPEGWAEALRDLLRPFYATVSGGASPAAAVASAAYPSLADGARAIHVVDAVLRSSCEGRWTALDE
jgi:predicted dehydrogenase